MNCWSKPAMDAITHLLPAPSSSDTTLDARHCRRPDCGGASSQENKPLDPQPGGLRRQESLTAPLPFQGKLLMRYGQISIRNRRRLCSRSRSSLPSNNLWGMVLIARLMGEMTLEDFLIRAGVVREPIDGFFKQVMLSKRTGSTQ